MTEAQDKIQYVGAVDQGTTSTRAIIIDHGGAIVSVGQLEHEQIFPHAGWVEHDAQEIWNDCLALCRQALRNAQVEADQLAAIGAAVGIVAAIAAQRFTTPYRAGDHYDVPGPDGIAH